MIRTDFAFMILDQGQVTSTAKKTGAQGADEATDALPGTGVEGPA